MGVIKYKIISRLLMRTCVTRGGQLVKAEPACTSLGMSSLEVLNCAIRSCFPNAQGLDQDRYGWVEGSKNDGGRHKQIRLPLPGWQLFGGGPLAVGSAPYWTPHLRGLCRCGLSFSACRIMSM